MKHISEETIIENNIQSITLSTGNVNRKYIVRDIIFATDRVEIDLFAADTNANDVFKGVSQQLREMAYEYEADAVINCHFEQRFVHENNADVVEILAYGTVIQFNQTTIG